MSFPDSTKIKSCTITIQPRYSETDQGGVVHHAVFPVYFEMGRTELLRANGLAYKDLEAAGVFFVIAELRIKYRRPAFYDEKLNLETICTNVTASKVEHSYKLIRPPKGEAGPGAEPNTGELLAEAESVLACVDAKGKIRRMPEFMYPEA
ncbi:MAG: thioesterase family protein [Sedimentisphaerales bacterium]|jgi:acyl-CoA thioester hydrolase